MRRNVKILLIFSISWMFVIIYYLQTNGVNPGNNSKVSFHPLFKTDKITVLCDWHLFILFL